MQLLTEYFKIQKQIYEYFGYLEDWKVIPLEDCTEYYWYLTGESFRDCVYYSENLEDLFDENGNRYASEIYTQRFLNKWVYYGKEYTMICVDTHTDGNKFLQIFSNEKRIMKNE